MGAHRKERNTLSKHDLIHRHTRCQKERNRTIESGHAIIALLYKTQRNSYHSSMLPSLTLNQFRHAATSEHAFNRPSCYIIARLEPYVARECQDPILEIPV